MTLSIDRALETLNKHWAVNAIGSDDLARAKNLMNEHLAQRALGKQITSQFSSNDSDIAFLERVALAFEMAAIEGLDELRRPSSENAVLRAQATAASFRVFDIRRLLPVPSETHDRIFFVLHLSAVAYCGDRWSDLCLWYKENDEDLKAPSVAGTPWDSRLLYRLFDCWVRLVRTAGMILIKPTDDLDQTKKIKSDLDQIKEIIAELRDDQKKFEEARLQNGSPAVDRSIALRLAALYHWAKGTELVALYVRQGQGSPFGSIDKHFDGAIKAATASGDAQHEIILRWLHATARIMVTNSLWWVAPAVNPRTINFVHPSPYRQPQARSELLPPQRAALLEQELLDQAKTAIVVDMPTSGGKALLAQFHDRNL